MRSLEKKQLHKEIAAANYDFLKKTNEEEVLENDEIISMIPWRVGSDVVFVKLKDGQGAIFKAQDKKFFEEVVKEGTFLKRERAAYILDRFLSFELVPPTVIRKIGDDIGSLQKFDFGSKSGWEVGSAEIYKREKELIKLWIFDYIIWAVDRGGNLGNILIKGDKLRAIDNSLSFANVKNEEGFVKEFFGKPLPQEIADIFQKRFNEEGAIESLKNELADLLGQEEAEACVKRLEKIGNMIIKEGMISWEKSHELTYD